MSSNYLNLAENILIQLAKNPEKVIIACNSNLLTGKELIQLVKRRVSQLLTSGVKVNDHVIVVTNRDHYFWVDLLAVWTIGAVTIPMEAEIDKKRAYVILSKSEANYMLGKLVHNVDFKINVLCEPPHIESKNQIDSHFQYNKVSAILFTSGSTGSPKGVVLSPDALLHNVKEVLSRIEINSDDNLFIATGFHFTSAICHFMAAMLSGAKFTCTENKLLHKDLFNQLKLDKATCFGGSPLQVNWISECAKQSQIDLKWIMSSGDNISYSSIQSFCNNLPLTTLYVVYGLTEVAGRLCILEPRKLLERKGSVGKPIAGMEIKILDDNLDECATGQIGEIFVSGQFIFDGYYGNVGESISEHGFNTGDLGYRDKDGYIFLAGRRDLVFKCAGKKVSLFPIINAINTLNLFQDFVVIPTKHDMLGLVPCVIYSADKDFVLKKGEVIAKLRKNLPSISIPRIFIRIEKIPRTGSGKPHYQILKKIALKHVLCENV